MPEFTITETEPTPLLKDFAVFTQYLKTHEIKLSRTNEFISRTALYEINQKMTYSSPDVTPRSDQTRYPLLHLFYHLSLSGKIFLKTAEKGNQLILKPSDRLQLYGNLTNAEKYFFLLETLWIDVDWKKLETGHLFRSPCYTLHSILDFLSIQNPGEKFYPSDNKTELSLIFLDWDYFFLYFSFFCFWKLVHDEAAATQDWPKRSFRAESIIPSNLGVAIAPVLREARYLFYWNLPIRREFGEWKAVPGLPFPFPYKEPVRLFEKKLKIKKVKPAIKIDKGEPGDPFFLPFIPFFAKGELQKTLPRKGAEFINGTYVFKVSLAKNLWRRVEISADDTLLELHRCIQEAYDFDDDHLYTFYMDGKRGSNQKFTSPDDYEGPHVNKVCIGELGLFPGQNILYLFDYGDEWHFKVELEEIRKEGPKPGKPKIIEQKGMSPKQYG